MISNKIFVSIVLPTHNEEKHIQECLENLLGQSYLFKEIVVVDGYSTDRTVEICSNYGVRIILSDEKPLGARYLGVIKSLGDIILFIDADQLFTDSSALDKLVHEMLDYGNKSLIIEEIHNTHSTRLDKALAMEKVSIHKNRNEYNADPFSPHPRLFWRRDIVNIYNQIPGSIIKSIFYYDDVILHSLLIKNDLKIATSRQKIIHKEENELFSLGKKWIKYGISYQHNYKNILIFINDFNRNDYKMIKNIQFISVYKYSLFMFGRILEKINGSVRI